MKGNEPMNTNRIENYEKLLAMNTIIVHLADEDDIFAWLAEGLPDGTETLEDVADYFDYMSDDEFKTEFNTDTTWSQVVKFG
jgi:hypothetical protein